MTPRAALWPAAGLLALALAPVGWATLAGPAVVAGVTPTTGPSAATLPERYVLAGTWTNARPARGLDHPAGVDLAADGSVAVAEPGARRVSLWRPDGSRARTWPAADGDPAFFGEPVDLALDPAGEQLYVADAGKRRVVVLNRRSGDVDDVWLDVGEPRGIAAGADGRVYVSDAAGGQLLVLGQAGRRLAAWGQPGSGPGQLATPAGLARAADGRVFVADRGNRRVQWFAATGQYGGALALDNVEQPGGEPLDVGVDGVGRMYVAVARGVLVFQAAGEYQETIPPLAAVRPEVVGISDNVEGVAGLAVLPDGALAFAYAPALRAGARIVVQEADGTARLLPGAVASTLPEPDRLAGPVRLATWEDPYFAHFLDATGLPRFLGSDGAPPVCDRPPCGQDPLARCGLPFCGSPRLKQDVGADFDATAVLSGNQVRVLSLACQGGCWPGTTFSVLDPDMMVTTDPGGNILPDRRWWNTALAYRRNVAVLNAGYGQVIFRSPAGDMLAAPRLISVAQPFKSFTDLAFDRFGSLWVLAREGSVYRLDSRGQRQGSQPLVGLAPRAGEALAVDGEDNFYVLTADRWILKFDRAGQPRAAWSLPDLAGPGRYEDIAAGADGVVLVPDAAHDRVLRFEQAEGPGGAAPPADGGPCAFTPEKSAAPARIGLGDSVTVTLRLDGGCGPAHAATDLVLVLDSGCRSMAGGRPALLAEAGRQFVAGFGLPEDRLAVVAGTGPFGAAQLRVPLTGDRAAVRAALAGWQGQCANAGGDVADGLRVARETLTGPAARAGAGKVVVAYPVTIEDRQAALWEARLLWAAGIRVIVVATGPDGGESDSDADQALFAQLATRAGDYHFSARLDGLDNELAALGRTLGGRVEWQQLSVEDRIPANMALDLASIQPPAEIAIDGALVWRFSGVRSGTLPPLRYRLKPAAVGDWPTNVEAAARFVDGRGYEAELTFPVPRVVVSLATATPTASPEPTPTSAPSATATPSATVTPSAPATLRPTATLTPRATRSPRPVLLPLAFAGYCRTAVRPVDVVLVLDTSSSMAGAKLTGAVQAARTFLALLQLPRDRAGIVVFDSSARIAGLLSGDPAGLEAALAGLETRPGTRIDLGLDMALAELSGARARANADPVIVLLTDGRPDDTALAAALASAATARRKGVTLFAIGLGGDVLPEVLAGIAGDPARVFLAPEAADLAAIYGEVARVIPCR